MFIQQSLDLLRQQIPSVAVRIWQSNTPEIPLGTVMLVTENQIVGGFFQHSQEIITQALVCLKQGQSISQTYSWANVEIKVCFEILEIKPTLVIVGAGHIAVPLYQLAKMVGFRTIVIDPRNEFACSQRFPDADQILVESYSEGLRQLTWNNNTYVVLITPGHVHDVDCLRIMLDQPVAYLGMICSLRRRESTFQLLTEKGYRFEQLQQIFAPIGLPIGGETPEEIAVSIMSELIAVRNRGQSWVWKIKKGEAPHGKSESL